MMSTREIVTLQIGHYANFVGTHLWNLQTAAYSNIDKQSTTTNEINFDVTFREGKTLTGEVTYTPRAVVFDLKGSLNTLKQGGVLYDLPTPIHSQWPSNVTLHEFSGSRKNDFLLHLEEEEFNALKTVEEEKLKSDEKDEDTANSEPCSEALSKVFNLDSEVKVWSDFLKPHLHHKTIDIISQYNHDDGDNFNLFSLGKDVCKKQMSEVEDRLHFFTEECDNFQGFHLLVDAHNGFSGFAGHLYEDYIEEEFSNKSCLVINTLTPLCDIDAQKCNTALFNMFLSIDAFGSCSGILPMSTATNLPYKASKSGLNVRLPFLDYNLSLPYHTSAILASAMDNFSLPYRLTNHVSHLGHHISNLTTSGRKVLSLQMSMPFMNERGTPVFDMVNSYSSQSNGDIPFPVFSALTPGLSVGGEVTIQNFTVSGLGNDHLFSSGGHVSKFRYSSAEDLLQDLMFQFYKTHASNIYVVNMATHICEPYPHFFSPKLKSFSSAVKRPRVESASYPSSLPIATLLQNNTGVGGHLREILEGVNKIRTDRVEQYLDGLMEIDDFKEKLDRFKSLIDAYEEFQPDMI